MLTVGCIGALAQTKKKRTTARQTTVTKPAQPQITKERMVGEDGFIWFKTKKGDFYGAEDTDGKTIVPIEYDKVKYVWAKTGTRFFRVTKKVNDKEYQAAYSPKGTCVISIDRGYNFVSAWVEDRKYLFFRVSKYGEGYGMCDAQGQEVIAPSIEFGYPGPDLEARYGTLYIQAQPPATQKKTGDSYGLYDANGNCIIPMNEVIKAWPNEWNTALVVIPYPGGVKKSYEKPIRLTTDYIYDYNIYDDMYLTPPELLEEANSDNGSTTVPQTNQKQSKPTGNYIPVSSCEPVGNMTVENDNGGNNNSSNTSSHHSSSSSSKMCGQCYGNGRCNSCSGKGWHYGSYGNGDKRVNCSSCSGTGTCRWCGGTGHR